MALDIIDGAVTPITGLTWNGKQVYQMQTLIPLLEGSTPLNLNIGTGIDNIVYRTSEDIRTNYGLSVSRVSTDSYRFTPITSNNVIGEDLLLDYTTSTGLTQTDVLITNSGTTLNNLPDGSTITFTNIRIPNLSTTIPDITYVTSNSESFPILLVSDFKSIGKKNIALFGYINTSGEIILQNPSLSFKNLFIQVQFTRV